VVPFGIEIGRFEPPGQRARQLSSQTLDGTTMDEHYGQELMDAAAKLREAGASTKIVGEGVGAFLVADMGTRGFELYRGDGDTVVIDPAEDEILKGEIILTSYGEAIATGLRWLNGARAV